MTHATPKPSVTEGIAEALAAEINSVYPDAFAESVISEESGDWTVRVQNVDAIRIVEKFAFHPVLPDRIFIEPVNSRIVGIYVD